jgi:hypothetical protein
MEKKDARRLHFDYEQEILNNPEKMPLGVKYAKDVFKGRWQDWEKRALVAAARDDDLLHCCVRYAAQVMHGPWQKLEPLLLEAFRNGRTYEGEPKDGVLSTSRRCMWEYLEEVRKKPWPQLAPFVVGPDRNLIDGVCYAMASGKARWPDLESQLLNPDRMEPLVEQLEEIRLYCSHVIKGRWSDAEAFIVGKVRTEATDDVAEQAILYAAEVIKEPWPEFEALLSGHPNWMNDYARDVLRGRLPETLHTEMVLRSFRNPNDRAVKEYFQRTPPG